MKCIHLSPACRPMNCLCEKVADDVTQAVLDQINRSRAHRKTGLCPTALDFDGVCHCNIIPEAECDELESQVIKQLDPMRLQIEHEINEEIERNRQLELRKNILKDNGIYSVGWSHITCSKDKSPQTMAKLTKSLLRNKPFADCIATIEFYGAEGQYHPHVHILYRNIQKAYFYKRDLCKKFGVDMNNEHFYKSWPLKTIEEIKEKEKYINGYKTDKKQNQLDMDDECRKLHNIPKIFSKGNIYNG